MKNLARANRQRKLAALEGAVNPADQNKAMNNYELMLKLLHEHKRRLKTVQSSERKAEVKAQFIPEYRDYLAGVIHAGTGQQNDVLTTVMLWCIDAGEYNQGLDLAEYVLTHEIDMPDQYERTAPTLVTEEVANQALKFIDSETPVAIEHLERVSNMVAELDIYDQVRAKLMKAMGITYGKGGDNERAIAHLKKALELDEKSGVKKLIQEFEKAQKNSAAGE
ncbi:phage terminase small subunit [Aliidiomarina sanyensis]|uniref:Uncharacterized protein n=1 Tax=Aliidiomarina sanyensis TaxID=1249555 RepID=A0A432WBB7_9GAMM|nr:phage terminase small subunit [Aliidiomarina sanyensis]RUO28176.1 hypothetical protein CWE11_10730 [Aliidiomarina sanyensis]